MGSMPLCFRYCRLMLDNTSSVMKVIHPAVRLNNSLCMSPWRNANNNFTRNMNFTATEGNNQAKVAKSETMDAQGNHTNEPLSEEELRKQVETLSHDLEGLTKQTQDLTDKYKRALADGENMRQRLTKQIDDAKIFAIQGFCKDILEVSDVLTKATESVPKEELTDKNPILLNLFEGLNMTQAQMKKVFHRHGLQEVNPLGEKFNPNLHEALFEKAVEGKAPGIVVIVSKVGYKLHERVIRPALVGVTK